MNNKDQLENYDEKTIEGIFIEYSETSNAYRVFNKKNLIEEETINVTFNEISAENTNNDFDKVISTMQEPKASGTLEANSQNKANLVSDVNAE